MASTLLLDQSGWDLALDVSGNIAVATEPYAQAQDAASSMRTFAGEVWYDRSRGVPYWEQILGHYPPVSLMRTYLEGAALLVPGIVKARAFFTGFADRRLTGQVQIQDASGQVSATGF
ncbi:hypothetical protein ACQKQD_18665 [Methylobacterium sp. NPDC080182]|uniref:hypothetical protein n=1 Tax=Methylobacterium sp. NPDC080182 TaxID=3390590 RepID=UPI003D070294